MTEIRRAWAGLAVTSRPKSGAALPCAAAPSRAFRAHVDHPTAETDSFPAPPRPGPSRADMGPNRRET